MPLDDYDEHRQAQEDIGFKISTFVAGMLHYFSLSFMVSILTYSDKRSPIALLVIATVNLVVFICLTVYALYVYPSRHVHRAIWKVVQHELFSVLLCLTLDLFT